MKLKDSSISSAVIGSKGSKQFKISDNKIIFDILRNKLYKDPIGAICREISANSRDANREVGKQHIPIKIKIFQSLDQIGISGDMAISFKDNGPGISPDRMDQIFIVYGESTKRDSNDLTGGFGLGAKTPFAYSDTFVVSTVCMHEGKTTKYTYVAAIDEEEKGTMHLFKKEDGDFETGTEIIIPIKQQDRDSFETKCFKYTKFWDVQPEFINFKTPIRTKKKFDFEDFQLWKYDDIANNSSTCVSIDQTMLEFDNNNNLPYRFYVNGCDIVFPFKNGVLDLAASREYIQNTQENIKEVNVRIEKLKSYAKEWVEKYIQERKTYAQALTAVWNSSLSMPSNNMTDEEYLFYVFSKIYQPIELKWEGQKLKDFHFNTLSFYNSSASNFNVNRRQKVARFLSYGNSAEIYFNSKTKEGKSTLYLIDTDDKINQRACTLVKEANKHVVYFYKPQTFVEYVKFNDTSIKSINGISEEFLKEFKKTNEKTYEAVKIKYDKRVLFEKEILDEVFQTINLSGIEPTQYASRSNGSGTKKKVDEPITVSYRHYSVYHHTRDHDSTVSYSSISDSLIKNKDKTKYKKIVLIKAKSISEDRSSGADSHIIRMIASIIHSLDLDYKLCIASTNYNTMISHGAIDLNDFISMLKKDHIEDLQKLVYWTLSDEKILRFVHDNRINFDIKDRKILDVLKIETIETNKTKDLSFSNLKKLLSDSFAYRSNLIFEKEILKKIKNEFVDDSVKILERYPMLSILNFDHKSESQITIINDYLKTIQQTKKKNKQP